jgi:hypothetical protein
MATALLSAKANSVIDSESPTEIFLQDQVITGTGNKPGSVVLINTADPDVSVATGDPADWDAAGNKPYGVLIEREDLDIDTDFPDNTVVRLAPLGQNAHVNVEVVTNAGAILKGDKLYLSTVAGLVDLITVAVVGTPTADEALAHGRIFVGTAMEDSANDASNTRWIKIKLS